MTISEVQALLRLHATMENAERDMARCDDCGLLALLDDAGVCPMCAEVRIEELNARYDAQDRYDAEGL